MPDHADQVYTIGIGQHVQVIHISAIHVQLTLRSFRVVLQQQDEVCVAQYNYQRVRQEQQQLQNMHVDDSELESNV